MATQLARWVTIIFKDAQFAFANICYFFVIIRVLEVIYGRQPESRPLRGFVVERRVSFGGVLRRG